MKINIELEKEEFIALANAISSRNNFPPPPPPPDLSNPISACESCIDAFKVPLKYIGADERFNKEKVYVAYKNEWGDLQFDDIMIIGCGYFPKKDFELGEGLMA